MVPVVSAPATLHELIETQARRTPRETALVFEERRLTYGELDRRADELAQLLRSRGAGPDVRIALFLTRSLELMVGIVGILKAGAAYVPIDPAYPRARVGLILQDCAAKLVLTERSLLAALPGDAPEALCLDALEPAPREARSPHPLAGPQHLAYVIYTSGSTGRPKGVCIEHRNIVNYVTGVAERLRFQPGMQHALISTIAADLGNTVVFPALATGGCLHVLSQERAESQALLSAYFRRHAIDVLKITPSHLAALQTGDDREQVMPRKRLILGGERCTLERVERLRALAPACEIHNHYGPTEATVGVLTYAVGAQLPATPSGTLPLGMPLPNSRIYVVDADGRPVNDGAQGELWIGGAGVARGYLNRAELTADKFIPDPFTAQAGARLYRTGDLGRRLPDGNIEFCGRIDNQVKLDGHRVELEEIEHALRGLPGVREAVVLAREARADTTQLAAYVEPDRPDQPLWAFPRVHLLPDGAPVAHLNRSETEYIYNEIFVLQAYLRHGIEIRDGDCIVDAGANIGLFTVFASRLARGLRILAFEPNPAAFACLKANAQAWAAEATCLPFGLSAEEKSSELTFYEGMSLLSGFYADAANERSVVETYVLNQQALPAGDERLAAQLGELIDGRLQATHVSARLRTLSAVLDEQGIERIDLLKINVEKSELDVLRGIAARHWRKVRQLVIEVDLGEHLEPITALLEQQGFDVLVEQDPDLRQTQLCYVYAVRRGDGACRLARQQTPKAHLRALASPDPRVLAPASLRAHTKERLPRYMVPQAFVLVEKFPLMPNGKIDRHALPGAESPRAGEEFVGPRTDTERALAAIWSEFLEVETIGVNDDFFELGGKSLLAMKVMARLRDVLGVEVELRTLFDHPTVAGLAEVLEGRARAVQPSAAPSRIEPRRRGAPAVLSFAQEQIWLLDQLVPHSPAYNIVDVIVIRGKYDASAMKRALEELLRRHDVLRTGFAQADGQAAPVVLPRVDLALSELDLSALPAQERERQWARVVHDEGRKHFDLAQAPLLRVALAHLSQSEHKLLLTIHHIVADEWSMELIHQELSELYAAFSEARSPALPDLPMQYADYAHWQRERLQGQALEQQIAYWTNELRDAPQVLALPADKPRPPLATFRGASESFALPKSLLERLQALARQEHTTVFMILEAAFAALLHRFTGQDDILVGTPISGRTHAETQRLVGCFLNTVVLRAQFTDGQDFRSLLHQVRERTLRAFAHADLPFARLVAELSPERDPSRTPLFQAMFILHDPGAVSLVSKVSGHRELQNGTSKFDLTLYVSETEKGIDAMMEYSTDLFEAGSIARLCKGYATLLEALVSEPARSLCSAPLLDNAERQQLLAAWNDTACALPGRELCLHALFERQAAQAPERVAVAFAEQSLTYGELDRRANQLARQLASLGVGPEAIVGLCVERSLDMVVGLLGILKAGGAYLPLAASFPVERLAHMAADSGMRVLVTHRDLDNMLSGLSAAVVHLDGDALAKQSSEALTPSRSSPEQLAYVLYTSGSTGTPKGVAVPHSAIVNFLLSMQREPGLTAADTLLAVTTLSFDIAALEIFLPLVTGAKVVLASEEEVLDPALLMQRLHECAGTVMQATPATWRALVNAGWSGSARLKALCGGEALPADLVQALLPRCAELWNMYGPTETTVWSAVHRVGAADAKAPIGRPIANTQVYVLDAQREPVPIGVVGELYIGGEGLARGYLHRPELTRERFVPSPFAPNARLYRTGDLARWLPTGLLECLGRTDQQVKLRGHRIEPGEIEALIARHPAIRQVAVSLREDRPGDKALVAYMVCDGAAAELVEQLRAQLRAILPDYMVPAHFVALGALPLTPNGKIDRKALPAPVRTDASAAAGYVAPRSESEKIIAAIWSELLGLPAIGAHDNVFHLGAHSLLAMRALLRMREALAVDLPLRSLFERPTVAGLAQVVDGLAWACKPDPAQLGAEPREEIAL